MRRGVILAVLSALIFVVQSMIFAQFTGITPRIEFNAADFGLSEQDTIKPSDLRLLKDYQYSFEKTIQDVVGSRFANVCVTNENYPSLNEMTLIYGTYFDKTVAEIGQNYVVISDELSFAEFKTRNSVGLELEVGGFRYTVLGVYHQNALLDVFSGNGQETVYVPQNSDFDRLSEIEIPIQRICFMGYEKSSFAVTQINADLTKITRNTQNYQVNDYTNSTKEVKQLQSIVIFVFVVLAIIIFIESVFLIIKKLAKRLGKAMQTETFMDAISNDITSVLAALVVCLTLALTCVILWRFAAFELYVPSKYISPVRLLDFDFYKNIVVSEIQKSNTLYAYKPSGYERLFGLQLLINIIFTITSIVLSINLFVVLRKFVRERINGRNKAQKPL